MYMSDIQTSKRWRGESFVEYAMSLAEQHELVDISYPNSVIRGSTRSSAEVTRKDARAYR
jgi:hypothetical protein